MAEKVVYLIREGITLGILEADVEMYLRKGFKLVSQPKLEKEAPATSTDALTVEEPVTPVKKK